MLHQVNDNALCEQFLLHKVKLAPVFPVFMPSLANPAVDKYESGTTYRHEHQYLQACTEKKSKFNPINHFIETEYFWNTDKCIDINIKL